LAYNHILKQRNGYLKMSSERGSVDWVAVESYDHALVKYGSQIFERRKQFIEEFIPYFKKYYKFIVDENEEASLSYFSELLDRDFFAGLMTSRQKGHSFRTHHFWCTPRRFPVHIKRRGVEAIWISGSAEVVRDRVETRPIRDGREVQGHETYPAFR
jgi:recombinational DNA repair ATPase RecF